MAYTATDIASIQAAILALSTGQRVVSITFANGKSIDYAPANMADLRALESNIASSLGTNRRQLLVASRKGL